MRSRAFILLIGVALLLIPGVGSAGPLLPVYIEDNHAGSFYRLANNLNWSEKYQLILFDRHSDATAVFGSDSVRKILSARKASGDNAAYFQSWKKRGIIQSYNWIEPLLPHPIYSVTWVPDDALGPAEAIAKKEEVIVNINEHVAAAPRSSENLEDIYTIRDFSDQKKVLHFTDPVIVTIDLDYFSDVPSDQIESKFSEVFYYVLSIKQLRLVTIAISRPYLKSDEQADLLLFTALKFFSLVINAKIYFEPFTSYGPDRSELARSYSKKGLPIPYFDLQKASSRLISLILQDPSRYIVHEGRKRWQKFLELWSKNYRQPELVLYGKGSVSSTNACYSFFYKDDFTISVHMPFGEGQDYEINWKAYSAAGTSYNILGKGVFADSDPAFVIFKEVSLSDLRGKRIIDSRHVRNVFDEKTGLGTARLFAEIKRHGMYYRTKTICVSKYSNSGYTGKLTEIFNLPYILGSGFLSIKGLSGADLHYGADCLNFIIYGRRRLGSSIPYLNDNNLRQFMEKINDVLYFQDGIAYNNQGKVTIDEEMIQDGLLLHFGTHIAALYEDNEPKNILNDDDLVIHQLENKAEIVKLKELKQAKKPFVLMKFR